MLKIKKGVDFNELKKFGLVETIGGIYEYRESGNYETVDPIDTEDWIFTSDIDRDLLVVLRGHSNVDTTIEIVYDLIKADIVEKV